MDALRSAGRAMIRSPSMAKQSWSAGRHKKLPENWTDTRETILEGMTFNLRHLGMTLVDQPKGDELSAAAVKRIVATAKASGKKPSKVISYCTADKLHDKVFAYIAQNTHNGTLECHAYLCSKRKEAQAVTLTVAQAFRLAFELWQATKEEKEQRVKSVSAAVDSSSSQSQRSNGAGSLKDMVVLETHSSNMNDLLDNQGPLELGEDLDEAFSRLAVSRTNPQVLDVGVTPQDWLLEPDWDGACSGDDASGTSPPVDALLSF
ncbi:hypothetical protein CRUP_019808 [Coryphaenoides rupestris]|nr:hypothetical protein CRUP_019808 [Coryphaenoides rupestris]